MSNPKNTHPDEAQTGGGIGDIGRQPLDQTSEIIGNGIPETDAKGEDVVGVGLTVDEDAAPSGADPDDDADETLGTVV